MLLFNNLPDRLSVESLQRFSFGNPDAAHDELIKDVMCLCRIRPIEEFLDDQKSILIGEKGTGKTAVFELLRENKLRFKIPDSVKHVIIVPINQQLDYRALKERVVNNIASGVQDESLRYRVVWELLILYFVIQRVREELRELPPELAKAIKEFELAFPINAAKRGFLQILLSGKRKVGIKLEASPVTGWPTADLYAQIGADENQPATKVQREPSLLRLGQLKQLLNDYLSTAKARVYVLIDRIDEFVIKEEYEIQKLTLQGLIGCERSYRPYHHLRVKLFLRQDLFQRTDLREFGADKVIYDSLYLVWTPEDIRDFLSKRILYNYFKVFELKELGFTLNEENLYVDRESNQSVRRVNHDLISRVRRATTRWVLKCHRVVKHNLMGYKVDPWEGRHTNFTDEISTEIIQTFFPEEVWRGDPNAPKKSIPVVEFLATHFNWSSDATTPRVMLMFAQRCIETITDYHSKNPDIADAKMFPILSRDIVLSAYNTFKDRLWEIVAQEGSQWRPEIEAFRATFASLTSVSFDQVQEAFPAKSDAELRELLAVLRHLGILSCMNPDYPLEQRYYRIPLLFRQKEMPSYEIEELPPVT